mmetsp:Transcript_14436/g.20156  ORF Transcript_14436/g.20156 Transcript_14436/m.20156 type:complete len:325 (+) Transcript_14436:1191-2165(+)
MIHSGFFSTLLHIQEIHSIRCCHRPVVVLSASVDVVERLLLEESCKAVLWSDLFDNLHYDNVLVNLGGNRAEKRSELILVRSNFTVSGAERNSDFEALSLNFGHALKSGGSSGRGSHVVIAHLLTTGSVLTDNGTTGHLEIGALDELFTRNQEDLLLKTDVGLNSWYIPSHQGQQTLTLAVQSIARTEEGSLLIKCMSVVGNEACRNENGISAKPYVGSRVNLQVSSSLVSGTETSVGIRRSIRFSLDKTLPIQFPNWLSVVIELEECILHLPGKTVANSTGCERLEPMAEKGSSMVYSPLEHGLSNFISSGRISSPSGSVQYA